MRKRDLNRLPPAKYYLLPHLIEPVKALCRAYDEMHCGEVQLANNCRLVEMVPGSSIMVCRSR